MVCNGGDCTAHDIGTRMRHWRNLLFLGICRVGVEYEWLGCVDQGEETEAEAARAREATVHKGMKW